jgi:hypothetical protein
MEGRMQNSWADSDDDLDAALASPTTAKGTSVAEAKIQKANLVSSGKQHTYSLFVPEGLAASAPGAADRPAAWFRTQWALTG